MKKKILYVTTYDANDITKWSGLGYFMAKSLEVNFHLVYVGPLKIKNYTYFKILEYLYKYLFNKKFLLKLEPTVIRDYASQINQSIEKNNPDIIFSPGTIPVSLLDTTIPIVIYTDASFSALVNYYPSYSNLAKRSIKNGHYIESASLNRCKLAIYSTDWAAQSATSNYNVDKNKVKVLPFGANISEKLTLADIKENMSKKKYDICSLLFIGVDWKRKGGDAAFKVTKKLNEEGIKSLLHVVGCKVPKKLQNEPSIKEYGFLNKHKANDSKILRNLFYNAHFLIVPTMAEAYGLVFIEANAYGLPSITFNTGGTNTIIKNNINGILLEPDADTTEFVDFIKSYFTNLEEYKKLALSSFNEFDSKLNWNIISKELLALIKKYC